MSYKSDIEIAREARKKPIREIGEKLGIPSDHLLPYGHDKAKVSQAFIDSVQGNATGKLVLVTAINRRLRARARPPPPWALATGSTGWARRPRSASARRRSARISG